MGLHILFNESYECSLLRSQAPPMQVVLRQLFEKLGATYIKLGQFIASSPTLFPEEYVYEFQKCLDRTEPIPWSVIKATIDAELGAPAHEQLHQLLQRCYALLDLFMRGDATCRRHVAADDTVRVLGRCLAAPEGRVSVADCAGQRWLVDGGRLVEQGSKRCLAAASGGGLALEPCADAPSQRWRLP